jgi:hypothetical protein
LVTVGFATAPPRTELFLAWAQYGTVSGIRNAPRARLWLLVENKDDPSSVVKVILATNDPATGQVVYEDLGFVADAQISRLGGAQSILIHLADGTQVAQVQAPCVCGAGSVGMAGPTKERHSIIFVDANAFEKITA